MGAIYGIKASGRLSGLFIREQRIICEVTIISCRSDFYIIRFAGNSGSGGIQVCGSRLHSTREDAEHSIPDIYKTTSQKKKDSVPHMTTASKIRGVNMQESYVRVECPCCSNKRLFDIDNMGEAHIEIKCPICKGVIKIFLHKNIFRTERIAAYK